MSKKIKNSLGVELPEYIEGYGKVKPFMGAFYYYDKESYKTASRRIKKHKPENKKLCSSIRDAIEKTGLKDNMTISFHHHLRNGDAVLILVVEEIAKMGIKNISICASSFTNAHDGLLEYIKSGVITSLSTSGLRGEIAKEISINNILKNPVVFRTHGGRARAIECGEVKIDVAFIGAPACDEEGNMNGSEGKSAFGSMGYPMVDALYAEHVIAITDNLIKYPLHRISIPQIYVDYVVEVDSLGDPNLIATGATRITKNPTELLIAEKAANVLIGCGLIKEGFSFQAGSGGASLAVCRYLKEYMIKNKIKGSFVSGGINAYLLELFKEGLFESLLDTQTFDGTIANAIGNEKGYIEMSASMYANPNNGSCVAHKLDMMMLSATEIDLNFNVNSITGSHGIIMGAIGGAPDTAAGSKVTLMTVPSIRKRMPIITDKVTNIVTPGDTVDILVSDRGVCVNPKRKDLADEFDKNYIERMDIKDLYDDIISLTGVPDKVQFNDNIVGVIEYRDGSVIDIIYQVKQ